MMSCEEFASKVSDYLDGRVPYGDKFGMWMHKLMCTPCRNYLRQMGEVVDFVHTHGEPLEVSLEPETKQELMERFHKHHDGCEPGKS